MVSRWIRRSLALVSAGFALASCYDKADRWLEVEHEVQPVCAADLIRCSDKLEQCREDGLGFITLDDCAARGEVCAPSLLACATCLPNTTSCDGATVQHCDSSGSTLTPGETCQGDGIACRNGGCVDLCASAALQRSNVGCEYWAVDLDNANVDATLNAASQQFAVVVSNPQPDLPAFVEIEQDDSGVGQPNAPISVASATIPPFSLRVFKLGPREVDGSPPGEFDTGSGTALTRHAYRIKSGVPVVVYQFNPLENANVFSNDASLLKPVEALGSAGNFSLSYVVLGWPQTIASTDDPNTNFNPYDPIDLRAFVTVVGTRPNTTLRFKTSVRILGSSAVPARDAGGEVEVKLNPFDVLNLETDDFNADFTGSEVWSDQPVVVFSGSEASDAPSFSTLATRRCCADHLEEQLDPVRTAGKLFAATISSNRTRAVSAAGATIGVVDQPEYFRVIAVTDDGARIKTTLGGPQAELTLQKRGDFAEIASAREFLLESDAPVMLGNISASQEAAGIMRGLPGGDPSFIIIPPIEQYRSSYVFLTPDKYSFDFIRVVAPPDTQIVFDGQALSDLGCDVSAADGLTPGQRGSATPPLLVHRCQLSFPVIDPALPSPDNLTPGRQNDGVHRLVANAPVGVLVDGFDAFVSYGYAAGTELNEIVPQ